MNGGNLLFNLPQAGSGTETHEGFCLFRTHVVGHTFLLTRLVSVYYHVPAQQELIGIEEIGRDN